MENNLIVIIREIKTQKELFLTFCHHATIHQKNGNTILQYQEARASEDINKSDYLLPIKQRYLNDGEYIYMQDKDQYLKELLESKQKEKEGNL